jgi:hypothetical protein
VAGSLEVWRTFAGDDGSDISLSCSNDLYGIGVAHWTAGLLWALLLSGALGILIAPLMGHLLDLFPPVVSGSLITLLGLSLMGVAISWVGGGQPTVDRVVNGVSVTLCNPRVCRNMEPYFIVFDWACHTLRTPRLTPSRLGPFFPRNAARPISNNRL